MEEQILAIKALALIISITGASITFSGLAISMSICALRKKYMFIQKEIK